MVVAIADVYTGDWLCLVGRVNLYRPNRDDPQQDRSTLPYKVLCKLENGLTGVIMDQVLLHLRPCFVVLLKSDDS